MIRFGIVGTGPFCRESHILSIITAGEEITAIYNRGDDNRVEALKMISEAGGEPEILSDPHAVCSHPDVDAVLLCVPPSLFPGLIHTAVWSGKHIFCEKPLAANINDALRIVQSVSHAKTVFHVGFVIRYSYVFQELMKILQSGAVGTPKQVWCRCYSNSIWPYRTDSWVNDETSSGGSLNSWAVHAFDLMQAMAGGYPVRCNGVGGHMARENTALTDGAYIGVEYSSGAIGSLQLCRYAPRGDDWMIGCIGTEGMVEAGYFTGTLYLRHTADDSFAQVPVPDYGHHSFDGMQQQMDIFIDACENAGSTGCGYREGYYATALAISAEKAVRSRKTIDIPHIEEVNA
ncbi:MAG: Gfo/Idh/MocA family oxidoreductase [Candidatus Auribacterota bacterium]